MSLIQIILLAVAIGFSAAVYDAFKRRMKRKSAAQKEGHEPAKKRRIVGHEAAEQATPMATRTIAPAFAEATDWSQYDQPAFQRKKTQKKRTPKSVKKSDAQPASNNTNDAKPAQSAPASRNKTRGMTPQQQMEEFRANSAARSANQKAQYEEV